MRRAFVTTNLLALFLGTSSCHEKDSGGGVDAAVVDAASSGAEAGAGTVACDDGTGATDCCATVIPGAACNSDQANCWSRCNFTAADGGQGVRMQFACTDGHWTAGHGLFPCMKP